MAETLHHADATALADSAQKKERRHFWNRVIGKSLLVLGGAIALGAYLPALAPLVGKYTCATISTFINSMLKTTALLGKVGGGIGVGVGIAGRAATEFGK